MKIETKIINITCSCTHKKEFPYVIQLAGKEKKSVAMSIQVDCPFRHLSGCNQVLSVSLPPGFEPKNDETMFRR